MLTFRDIWNKTVISIHKESQPNQATVECLDRQVMHHLSLAELKNPAVNMCNFIKNKDTC